MRTSIRRRPLGKRIKFLRKTFHALPDKGSNSISELLSCREQRWEVKHVLLPATGHNVIERRGEMGTIALNNYLGKIFFLYLPRRDIVLRAFEPLIPAAAAPSPSFVQVMLISTGHSPGVLCLPRQLGQWVRKSAASTCWLTCSDAGGQC